MSCENRRRLQQALHEAQSVKTALYIDPTLLSSPTVTAQIGKLNLIISTLKEVLDDQALIGPAEASEK